MFDDIIKEKEKDIDDVIKDMPINTPIERQNVIDIIYKGKGEENV